jgi:hypothetical protein
MQPLPANFPTFDSRERVSPPICPKTLLTNKLGSVISGIFLEPLALSSSDIREPRVDRSIP